MWEHELEKLQYENAIRSKLKKIKRQRDEIMSFIEKIDDSFIRQIMFYRHVQGMNWTQVSMHIGGNNTADGCRKAHDRYLKKINDVRFVRSAYDNFKEQKGIKEEVDM